MAAAHVQTVTATATGTGNLSATLTLTAGNAAIVHLFFDASAGGTTTQTVGDSVAIGAPTLPEVITSPDCVNYKDVSGLWVMVLANYNVAGGSTTFTFTRTASCSARIFVTEVSGLATSAALDKAVQTNYTSAATHATASSGVLAQADEFALAALHGNGSGGTSSVTVDGGFTVPTNGNQLSGATPMPAALAYLVTAATTAVATTFDYNGADTMSALTVLTTFKAAAAAGGSVVPVFVNQFRQRWS